MRQKKMWRYFCDHCNKSMGSSFHMRSHEKHCTMNPERQCRMCQRMEEVSKDIETLIAIVDKPIAGFHESTERGKELLDATKGCPACALAAIRQHRAMESEKHKNDPTYYPTYGIEFDYKKACKEFWEGCVDRANEY